MSQEAAEELVPTPNMAIISIRDPGKTVNLHPYWGHILTITFNDIRESVPEFPDWIMFTPEMAERIEKFCDHLPSSVTELVVHCRAGISRSAAVAKYLSIRYKYDFPKDYDWFNPSVYDILISNGKIRKTGIFAGLFRR